MLTVIYLFALYGIGRITEKVFRIFFPYPFTIILGLACLIVLGGVLNFAGIAYPLVLDAVILSGLGYFALTFFKTREWRSHFFKIRQFFSKTTTVQFLPPALLIGIVFFFSAFTLSSPEAFNFHDDLEKYINHPIRMLSTGSLSGGHFNALGSETLGGQAFLHGFVAAHWPIGYVNSVDSVFGLALCLMAAISAAFSIGLPVWYTLLVLAVPVFINPQIVNISASYTASALMLFLFCGTWIELKNRNNSASPWPHAICTGFVYSALVALKTSFLLLPLAHLSVLSLGLAIYTTRLKEVFSWAIKVVISSIIFLLPWIMIYSSRLSAFFSDRGYLDISLQEMDYFRHTTPIINPFSLQSLFWGFGDNFSYYTLTILLILFCGIILIAFQFPGYPYNKVLTATALAACLTPPLLYGLNIFIISSMLFGPESSLRYLCPVIIAAAPSAMIMAAASTPGANSQIKTKRLFFKRPIFIIAVFSLILLIAFSASFSERIKQAFTHGSILSFGNLARDPKYVAYNHYVFSAAAKKKVHTAQQIVPQNETLATWTSLALYLDYQRNRIIDIEPAGLASPLTDFPFGQGIEDGIKYFKTLGIDYVLWQYRGYAVRSEQSILAMAASPYKGFHMTGVRTHQFLKFLINLTKQSELLYDDGSIVILKVPPSNKIS
jgi:hypothetical protein